MTLKEALKVAESVVNGMGLTVLSALKPQAGAVIFLDHTQSNGNSVSASFDFREEFDSHVIENLTRNAVSNLLAKYAETYSSVIGGFPQ